MRGTLAVATALGIALLAAAAAVVAGEATVFEGFYELGDELSAFQTCGSKESLWVDGATEAIQDRLAAEHQRITHNKEGEPVYARFRGTRQPRPAGGFDEDYDGVLIVTEILEMRPRARKDCGGPEAQKKMWTTPLATDAPPR
jgi:hypothetical protein